MYVFLNFNAKPHAKPNAILSAKNSEYAVRNNSRLYVDCLMIVILLVECLSNPLSRTKKSSEN